MKDFFMRIRHWLIKKLGGFTVQRVSSAPYITKAEINTKIIRAEMRLVPEMLEKGSFDIEKYCKNRLRDELVRKLQESGDVIMESSEDIFRGEVIVRATLYVVEGEKAALYMHSPMPEAWGYGY